MNRSTHHDEFVPRVEEDQVSRRRLLTIGVVAVVIAIVGIVVADALLRTGRPANAEAHPEKATAQIGIVEQTLILDTRRGLDTVESERRALDHFGWADRSRGVARIPINQAMDLATDPAFVRRALASEVPDAGGQEGM